MDDTRQRPALELLRLRSATTAYLKILEEVEPWAEQAADVAALRDPRYSALFAEIQAARQWSHPPTSGTPAAIARLCAVLLGEA